MCSLRWPALRPMISAVAPCVWFGGYRKSPMEWFVSTASCEAMYSALPRPTLDRTGPQASARFTAGALSKASLVIFAFRTAGGANDIWRAETATMATAHTAAGNTAERTRRGSGTSAPRCAANSGHSATTGKA